MVSKKNHHENYIKPAFLIYLTRHKTAFRCSLRFIFSEMKKENNLVCVYMNACICVYVCVCALPHTVMSMCVH